MWGTNSKSQRFQSQSNNLFTFDIGKNNNLIQNQGNNYNNNNEFNLLYQTPIKQFENLQNNNNCNTTPFRFDFNHYFGNLWSSGQMPNNQLLQQQINLSPSQFKDNIPFYKKSIEKSYKLTPISQIKDSYSHNNSNSNNKNIILNQNNDNISNNKLNEIYNINNCSNNTSNINDLSKKNLNELFNNAKNDTFLHDENKRKVENNNLNNNKNNSNNNYNIKIRGKNEIKRRNYNLQISRQFIFSSPCNININKPKKIFECSGSTIATNTSNKTINKNRRFRKNNEQIALLKKFYSEHKHWSKKQIKEISQKIGLKENKVYKWLWDQRNKEIKATKFVVKKENNE